VLDGDGFHQFQFVRRNAQSVGVLQPQRQIRGAKGLPGAKLGGKELLLSRFFQGEIGGVAGSQVFPQGAKEGGIGGILPFQGFPQGGQALLHLPHLAQDAEAGMTHVEKDGPDQQGDEGQGVPHDEVTSQGKSLVMISEDGAFGPDRGVLSRRKRPGRRGSSGKKMGRI